MDLYFKKLGKDRESLKERKMVGRNGSVKMNFVILAVFLAFLVGGFFVWSFVRGGEGKISTPYENITPQQAKEKLALGEDIILLDVRTKEEYLSKHIPQSTLIPLNVLEKEALQRLVDKEQEIIVYCRSGNRSAKASKILIKLGYSHVYNLGGINQWPYDIESGQ